jgi:hypothetical protein
MWKITTNGLVILAGLVSVPKPITHQLLIPIPSLEYPADPRLDVLRNFFAASAAPAQEVSHIFLQVADTYGLDWRLLPSISFVESGGGKTARNNNLFGWDSGRADFPSLTASIQAVAYRLTNSPLYRDKPLDEILSTYNPNADYARKVKWVMRKISPAEILHSRSTF